MADEELALEQEPEQGEVGGGEGEELSADDKFMARLKEAVQVDREDLGGLRLRLTITVPRDLLDDRLHEQFNELRREALIPGFRKGHAPLKLVEKRFGSDVNEELKGKLVGSAYMAAVEKLEIKTLGDPFIWIKVKEDRVGEDQKTRTVEAEKLLAFDKALDYLTLPKDGALAFRCEVELTPQFDLPKLDGIPLEKPTVTIDDEDVDAEVHRLLRWQGTFQPVEGEIEPDDLLYAAMKMTVGGDVIASDPNYEMAARALRVEGVMLSGLGEALVEHKVGETVTIEGTIPDDHAQIDLRGKPVQFEFVIQEIKRWTPPELDEKLLETIGYESKDQLRGDIRARMEQELDQIIARRLKEQVGEYLVNSTNIELPTGLSQRQTERSVARRMIQMYQEGVPQADVDKKMDELRSSAHDQVVRDLKLYFILDRIASEREVEVEDEEMNGAIAQIARRSGKRFDRVRDELAKGDGMMSLYMRLRDEKVLSSLVETAEIKEVEGPKKTRGKKASKKKDE